MQLALPTQLERCSLDSDTTTKLNTRKSSCISSLPPGRNKLQMSYSHCATLTKKRFDLEETLLWELVICLHARTSFTSILLAVLLHLLVGYGRTTRHAGCCSLAARIYKFRSPFHILISFSVSYFRRSVAPSRLSPEGKWSSVLALVRERNL